MQFINKSALIILLSALAGFSYSNENQGVRLNSSTLGDDKSIGMELPMAASGEVCEGVGATGFTIKGGILACKKSSPTATPVWASSGEGGGAVRGTYSLSKQQVGWTNNGNWGGPQSPTYGYTCHAHGDVKRTLASRTQLYTNINRWVETYTCTCNDGAIPIPQWGQSEFGGAVVYMCYSMPDV